MNFIFQSEVRNLEEERERLRKELHKVKEVLHEQNHLHSPIYQNIIDDNITDNARTSTSSAVDCASEQSSSTPLNDSIQVSIVYIIFNIYEKCVPSKYITYIHLIVFTFNSI